MSLSGGWEVRFSNSRRLPYFYNPTTRASMWELPDGITEEQARALPGGQLLGEASQSNRPAQVRASHLLVKHRDSRRPSSWREVCVCLSDEIKQSYERILTHAPSLPLHAQRTKQLHSFVSSSNSLDHSQMCKHSRSWPASIRAYYGVPTLCSHSI